MPTAEILSQGDEVVTGQTVNTNAAWLAEQLHDLGFSVVWHVSVGDVLDDIRAQVRAAADRADLVVSTGGLGPTDDDLTAQAVAEAFDRPLALDERVMAHIAGLYARFGRTMPEVNRKQAWLPHGCIVLDNHWGTAPGFAVEESGALLAFLPGVPTEMRKLFQRRLLPLIEGQFDLAPGRLVTLRTTGIGESNLQERVGTVDHDAITVSYRTILPENHIKLRFEASVPEEQVRAVVDDVAERIGRALFTVEGLGDPGGDLATVAGRALAERGETLAAAESCTGGLLAAMCTAVPGASAWFLQGVVSYANDAKVQLLGVSPSTLEDYGAVSTEVCHQMASGIRERAGSTYGIGITGIAGPSGGSEMKPVGTVHVALAAPDAVHHRKLRLPGDRRRIQQLAAAAALDLLRRKLQEKL
ncbi:MAG: competence/damage-inducible protein A [Deltaproteobacteria bacterium]|nr:competence/damage-inducible protein A [Deltaproteobacteria bacterium]MBW2254122.1 competence/damage-inducible protein A [Deltaproteobacteria bacterium]